MFKLRKRAKWALVVRLAVCAVLLASLCLGGAASGAPLLTATAPGLGVAGSFSVLGGSTVTNTGSTNISGDLGVSPGSAVTGFPPGNMIGGTIHTADALANQAQSDAGSAYNNIAGQACNFTLTGQDLGGMTLIPGVYCFSSSAQLTGRLNLDFQGNSDAVFVFKMASTLTTGSSASVNIINGGSVCNVYWMVGSSATLGTGTNFAGTILALASVTLTTGASVSGRAFARTGAVTMDSNNVSNYACYRPPASTATATVPAGATATATIAPASPTGTATVPAPTATATAPGPTATVPAPTATATAPGPTATVPARTATATVAGPTNTPVRTATSIPPVATATSTPQVATATSVPPAATATSIPPTATPVAIAVVAVKLPVTGAPPSTGMFPLVLAVAGAALVGLSMMLRRRRDR